MEEQELNKKLAEWAGLIYDASGAIEDPDNHTWSYHYFTHSLDACFKWLVPKVIEELDPHTLKIELKCGRTKEKGWTFLFEDWQIGSYYYAQAITPALALCKAIEKLIDAETE